MGLTTEEREACRLADLENSIRWQCMILGYRLAGLVTSDDFDQFRSGKALAQCVADSVAEMVASGVNEKFAEVLGKWEALAATGQTSELLTKIRALKGRL